MKRNHMSLLLMVCIMAGVPGAAVANGDDIAMVFATPVSSTPEATGLERQSSYRGVTRQAESRIDLSAITDERGEPVIGGEIIVTPYPGETYRVEGRSVEDHVKGWSWKGDVEGVEHGEVSFTFVEDSVHGTIDIGGAVTVLQGDEKQGYYFATPDPASYSGMQCTHMEPVEKLAQSKASGASKGASAGRTFDVLALYSPAVAAEFDETALINNAAAVMNQSFDSSGIDAAVRIVGYRSVPYSEVAPINSGDVTYMAYSMLNEIGAFAGLADWREDYGADFVLFIYDADDAGDTCGGAWTMDKETVSPYPDNSEEHYVAVTGDECIDSFRNFSHELGHALGAQHDLAGYPFYGTKDPKVITTDSYGYTITTSNSRDIMGSLGSCSMSGCSRLNRWSDPSYLVGGVPLGSGGNNDLVNALDTTVPLAAAYRGSGDPTPGAPGSVTVNRAMCYGANTVSWATPTGTVGWYEMQLNQGSWVNAYRGMKAVLHQLNVDVTTSVRARACNSSGCSSWVNGNQTAIYHPGC